MAWTTPGTAVAGDVLTASFWNLNVRDNLNALVPPGAITLYAGSSAPSGYLNCDGSAVSRTTYAALFAAIGTRYGSGDGSTTFNVPSVSGRVPVGITSGTPVVPTTVSTNAHNHTHGGVVTGASSTYGVDGGAITHTVAAIQFLFIIKT